MARKSKITPEMIEGICRSYYLSHSSQRDVARQFRLSETTIKKVIDEHGGKFCTDNKDELLEWRKKR